MQRYQRIGTILKQTVSEPNPLQKTMFTEKLDNILLHRRWGYLILLGVLFLLFQSMFWLAEYPMNFIEWAFGEMGFLVGSVLPEAWWSDLLVNGLLAGLGGIIVFIPQIMILFGLITILEDTVIWPGSAFLRISLCEKWVLTGKV